MKRAHLFIVVMLLVTVFASSCSKKLISGTKIEDTPDNREVIETFLAYAKAVETRDIPALEALVSKDYHDNNGSDDPANDVDYEGLMQFFHSPEFVAIMKLHATYVIKDLQFKPGKKEATLFYFYELQAKRKSKLPPDKKELSVAKGTRWLRVSDNMVMKLRKENGKWLIISGL